MNGSKRRKVNLQRQQNNMKYDFCIVGGGVSGLMTALVLQKYFPLKKIGLIYSPLHKEIGVGESTNISWQQFLEIVDIDPGEAFRYCDATPKYAVKQINWLRDNHTWTHSLSTKTDIVFTDDNTTKSFLPLPDPSHYWSKRQWMNIDPEEEIKFLEKFSCPGHTHPQDAFEFSDPAGGHIQRPLTELLFDSWLCNFDNFKAIDFFRKVCKERGVDIVEDTIIDHTLNANTGYIESLKGEKDSYISPFYFDCTGFKSLLLGEIVGSKRTDFSDDFLVNQFTAFPTPLLNSPNSAIWVETEGKDDCWTWRIETAGRGGNGVLASSEFMTDESLENHVKEMGGDINDPRNPHRKHPFIPNYRERGLHKNVLGVGLSGAFFEPLQATTFGYVLRQLILFIHTYNAWTKEPEATEKYYNDIQLDNIKNIYYFLRTQYITQKNTPFWKAQREEAKYSFDLKEKLKVWKYRPPFYSNEINATLGITMGCGSLTELSSLRSLSFFQPGSFYQLLCGMEMIDHDAMLKYQLDMKPQINEAIRREVIENRIPSWLNTSQIPTSIFREAIKDISANPEKFEKRKVKFVGLPTWTDYEYVSNGVSYLIPIHAIFLRKGVDATQSTRPALM